MPLGSRSSVSHTTWSMGMGLDRDEEKREPTRANESPSSTILSHAPHSGHFPIHLGVWYPQDWQAKMVFWFFFTEINLMNRMVVTDD
jgi:hypothetical protein